MRDRPSDHGRTFIIPSQERTHSREGIMNFMLLKDAKTEVQYLVRYEHISAAEIKKGDESVIVYLAGGHMIHLTHDQSKQFVHSVKSHMQPA
jgi:hypothetical protein